MIASDCFTEDDLKHAIELARVRAHMIRYDRGEALAPKP
jgi:hypothetical protein